MGRWPMSRDKTRDKACHVTASTITKFSAIHTYIPQASINGTKFDKRRRFTFLMLAFIHLAKLI